MSHMSPRTPAGSGSRGGSAARDRNAGAGGAMLENTLGDIFRHTPKQVLEPPAVRV
jgi:hypothetical protein